MHTASTSIYTCNSAWVKALAATLMPFNTRRDRTFCRANICTGEIYAFHGHKTLNAQFVDGRRDAARRRQTREKSCLSHLPIRVGGSAHCRYTIKHQTHSSLASSLFDSYVRDGMAVRSTTNSPSNFSLRWNICNNILFIRLFFARFVTLAITRSFSFSFCVHFVSASLYTQ